MTIPGNLAGMMDDMTAVYHRYLSKKQLQLMQLFFCLVRSEVDAGRVGGCASRRQFGGCADAYPPYKLRNTNSLPVIARSASDVAIPDNLAGMAGNVADALHLSTLRATSYERQLVDTLRLSTNWSPAAGTFGGYDCAFFTSL